MADIPVPDLGFRLEERTGAKGFGQWWVVRDDGIQYVAGEDLIALWLHCERGRNLIEQLQNPVNEGPADQGRKKKPPKEGA